MPSQTLSLVPLAVFALAGCQQPAATSYAPIDTAAITVPTSCTEVSEAEGQVTCRVVASHLLDETARQGGMKGRYQVMDYDVTMVVDKDQREASRLSLVMEQPESTAQLTFRGAYTEPLKAAITWQPSFELSGAGKGKMTVTYVKPGISRFDADLPQFVRRIIRNQMNAYEAWQKELAVVATAAVNAKAIKTKAPAK